MGLYRIKRALERSEMRRKASDERKGMHSRRSRREKNLRRLIEMYQQIKPSDPADWPRSARSNERASGV